MSEIVREHVLTGRVGAYVDRVEAHRVTLPPGQQAGLHVHPGGVSGYVETGRIVFEIDGQEAEELGGGSVFHEPPGVRIRRFDNLSADEPATFVACYLLTGDQPLIQAVPAD